MSARLARIPIRLRITIVFATVLAVVLTGIGSFLYLRFRSGLDGSIDQALRTRAGDVAALVQQADRGLTQSGANTLTARGEAFAQILTVDGQVFDATPLVRRAPLLNRAQIRQARSHSISWQLAPGGRTPEGARLLATPVRAQGRRLIVVVGVSLGDRTEALAQLAGLLLVGGVAALLLVSAAGYLAVAAALAPIESMRIQASTISGGDAGGRLPVPPADDEVARLGTTLNGMLARLDATLARERRFVADASHELRTPLGVLKTELELALRGTRSKAELTDAIRSAATETDRVVALAEDLLVLARSDHGALPVQLEPVRVETVLDAVRARFAQPATELGRPLQVGRGAARRIRADPRRLEQALGNLVDNALRHGSGAVTLDVVDRAAELELHVTDGGRGLSPAFAAVAFDRFTREDHGRGPGGSGLGLAIVAAVAKAHGGQACAANRDGGGSDFWLTIPRRSAMS